jgi:GrpB-like predicted nucleotidyltransferase (UPF0157 family)
VTEDESLNEAIFQEVVLQPHDPTWATAFASERHRLLSLFPAQRVDVEHIGSTAVPGLLSKPVVDMLAGVRSMTEANAIVQPLCRAGYTTSAEFNATLLDSRWLMRWADGRRTHHLHIAVHGSDFWSTRLRFRDALRANAALARRYSQLKSTLAVTYRGDREAYTSAKSEFIEAAMLEAGGQHKDASA